MGGAQSYSVCVDVTQVEGCHGEKAFGRSRSGWAVNIKSYLREIACEGVYWFMYLRIGGGD
jgi:hypothetical protein